MQPRFLLISFALVLGAAAFWGAMAFAQDGGQDGSEGDARAGATGDVHPVGEYAGVVPGTANLPPRAPGPGSRGRGRRAYSLVTWPGFQVRPDGASRIFVQTTGPIETSIETEGNRAVVTLKQTRIHLRNNRHPLETRFFNTPVARAHLEKRRNDVAIVLDLRTQVTPSVTSESAENGYYFVLIEFPSGEYLPDDAQPTEEGAAAPSQR